MSSCYMMTDDLLLNDNNGIDINQLEQQLEYDAESAIFIAALPSMFPENHELIWQISIKMSSTHNLSLMG